MDDPSTYSRHVAGKLIWINEDTTYYAEALKAALEQAGAKVRLFDNPMEVAKRLENTTSGRNDEPLPDLIFTDLTFSPPVNETTPDSARFRAGSVQEGGIDLKNGGLLVINASRAQNGKLPIPVILMTNRQKMFDKIEHPAGTDVYLMDKSLPRFKGSDRIVWLAGSMLRPGRVMEGTMIR